MVLQEFFNSRYYGNKNIYWEITKIKFSIRAVSFFYVVNMYTNISIDYKDHPPEGWYESSASFCDLTFILHD